MLWALLFSFPSMAGVQEISARVGRVTGMGIAGNFRGHYFPRVLHPIVARWLLTANVINLGADIGAMGIARKLLIGGPALLYSVGFGRRMRFQFEQSNQCAFLEYRDQWGRRSPDHVSHDADDRESEANGNPQASVAAEDRRLGGDRGNVRCSSRDDRYLGRNSRIESESPGKEKPPESAPGAFEPAFAAGPKKDEKSYALVRAESTPLASEPMLLPSAR
jgi:hypothetical protein